jgi:outer membrane immunogenic protein
MRACRMIKLALAAAMLASAAAVSDAAEPVRYPAYPAYPAYAPPPIPLVYNWTGFYVGGHVGVGWSGGDGGDNSSGFLGGGQAGFNYQINQWVLGVEGQFSWTGIKDNVNATFVFPGAIATANAEASLDWVSTFGAKFGYAFDRWLIYGKAGGAWAHATANIGVSVIAPGVVGGIAGSIDQTVSGWMLGIGTEYALWNNWSAKIEYNMMDFGSSGPLADDKLHVIKAGINYKFGGPGGPF